MLAVNAGGPTVHADASFSSGRLVLARYDGCSLEILPPAACSGQGNYTMRHSTPRATGENRVLRNRAELIAEAPLLAAQIGGSLRAAEGVGVVLAESGFLEASPFVVTRDMLQGDRGCVTSATHFVRIAVVGAYDVYRDKVRALETRAGLPFFGAGGGMSYGRSSFARAGDVNACFMGNLALCSAPVRYVLGPIQGHGAGPVCPEGQVQDGRGGCVEYVNPRTAFQVSVGVGGNCTDGAGLCEFDIAIDAGGRRVDSIAGPQDAGTMAPAPVGYQFSVGELASGIRVKIWERDFFESDWRGECMIQRAWDQLLPYVLRARGGQPPTIERMGCGGQELTFTIRPINP